VNTDTTDFKVEDLHIRPAQRDDRGALATLLAGSIHFHQHLDWVSPLELLGQQPFLIAEINDTPVACLACPIDPAVVAWIRLYALRSGYHPLQIWSLLWDQAESQIVNLGAQFAASIITNYRFTPLVQSSQFQHTQDVIFLEWAGESAPPSPPLTGTIRPLKRQDLPQVTHVDQTAFEDIWAYSLETLSSALQQAAWATVVELDGKVIAYQLTTLAPFGAHLARLAVLPEFQDQHIGRALVTDLLDWACRGGDLRISVNTQSDNIKSQRLYQKLGFTPTGLSYPVYRKEL
jgi:ribosomal protein S18 acetylase RimI-like enzyme